MKFLTIEAYERFRAANQPAIDAAARVGESARRIQEFALQISVIEKAREEETGNLRAREEDLRLAQEQRDAFLADFADEDRQRLIAGRRTAAALPPSGPPSPPRAPGRKQGGEVRSIGDPMTIPQV